MKESRAHAGVVYLVGAGPGDPELLTVRALRLLQTADLILHDDLVSEEVLSQVGQQAEIISVGKRFGRERTTQPEIHDQMIRAAEAGRAVVRLKSGDPLIFGRAGEEIAALRAASVAFEVVPGVTAALAAGAALALPLTDRDAASTLIFLTGHHAGGRKPAGGLWEGQLPAGASVVVYMPGRDLQQLAGELRRAGLPADAACVAVSHVASPRQTRVACRLDQLGEVAAGPAPLLLILGPAVEAWLEESVGLEDLRRELQSS